MNIADSFFPREFAAKRTNLEDEKRDQGRTFSTFVNSPDKIIKQTSKRQLDLAFSARLKQVKIKANYR